jgi:hypothetical protein
MEPDADELDSLTRDERGRLRRLLIRAVTAAAQPADDRELRAMIAAAPAEHLPAAASLHRVSGTVLRGLDGAADALPPPTVSALRETTQLSAFNHLVMVGALSQLAEAFDDAGLTWVVMKGPVVAALYPDVGDRSYGDLDLLVDRTQYATAMRLLEQHGFAHTIHDWALAEAMMAGQVGMRSGRVSVDLHWHLHYSTEDRRPYSLDPDAMLERRRRFAVPGLTVPTLDEVDTVLSLAFHAARSDGHRLVWLKDIERAVVVGRPDFDELVRRCQAARCAPPVGLMLGRAQRTIGAEIPDDVIRALTPAALREADRAMCALRNPIQLHDRATINRAFARSVRSSLAASVAEVPTRAARLLRRRWRGPVPTETDSPEEKASYLAAVAAAPDR